MKRIVFSQYYDKVDPFRNSSNDHKSLQFKKYYSRIYQAQKNYASKCNADYVLHTPEINYYPDLQFQKIYQMEQYADQYDQILYLDFDVVPTESASNIFNVYNQDKIYMHPLKRDLVPREIELMREYGGFDNQSVFCKTAAKKAMLLLEDINGNNLLYNTGVTLAGKETIKRLEYSKHKPVLDQLLDEAKDDCIYPEEITKNFFYNNEVYISFLVEKLNIDHVDLPLSWNYILDGYQKQVSNVAHLVHHVNKEFWRQLSKYGE